MSVYNSIIKGSNEAIEYESGKNKRQDINCFCRSAFGF